MEQHLCYLDMIDSFVFSSGKYTGSSFITSYNDDAASGFTYRHFCLTKGGFLDPAFRLYGSYAYMKDSAERRRFYRMRECGWFEEESREYAEFFRTTPTSED